MNSLLEKAFSFQIIETKKLNGYENENYLIKTVETYFLSIWDSSVLCL